MDWRSSSERVLLGVFLTASLAGCGRYAVRATEKEYLADRVMAFDEAEQETRAEESVLKSREGSDGPESDPGGESGCE